MDELEIIKAGRQYLAKHGWIKGSLVGPDGRVCALGALAGGFCELRGVLLEDFIKDMSMPGSHCPEIITSCGFTVLNRGVRTSAGFVDALKSLDTTTPFGGYTASSLPKWNDDFAGSELEVLAAFDRTIEFLEAEASHRERMRALAEGEKMKMKLEFFNECSELGKLPSIFDKLNEPLVIPDEWTKVSYVEKPELVPA